MSNPWSLQHEALSMQMYAEHVLHRSQEHRCSEGPSSSAALIEPARRPCAAPQLASGGSMGSMHSATSMTDIHALSSGAPQPRVHPRIQIIPHSSVNNHPSIANIRLHQQQQPSSSTMPSSYFLTTAQSLLQQQVAQLAPQQYAQHCVRPRRSNARRSLSAAMDAAATSYESKASVGGMHVQSLLGKQSSPASLTPSPPCLSTTSAANGLHTTLQKPTACQHLVLHVATQLGAIHRGGCVHGHVSLASVACVGAYEHVGPNAWRLCDAGTLPLPHDAPEYIAPELRSVYATGRQPHATCRSDMFALGVVLFKLLTHGKKLCCIQHHVPVSAIGIQTRSKRKQNKPEAPVVFAHVAEAQQWLDACINTNLQHLPEQYLGAVDLLRKLLKADPAQRASAADVLAHPWVASAAPVLSAKPMSIRTRGSPTTPLDASSEDAIAESPDSCASITSNVASFSSSTPTEHAERGLRNWWAPQPPWPPAMRATMARPPRPDRVPSYVVLPACMSAHIPQIDVRMPVPDPPQHAA